MPDQFDEVVLPPEASQPQDAQFDEVVSPGENAAQVHKASQIIQEVAAGKHPDTTEEELLPIMKVASQDSSGNQTTPASRLVHQAGNVADVLLNPSKGYEVGKELVGQAGTGLKNLYGEVTDHPGKALADAVVGGAGKTLQFAGETIGNAATGTANLITQTVNSMTGKTVIDPDLTNTRSVIEQGQMNKGIEDTVRATGANPDSTAAEAGGLALQSLIPIGGEAKAAGAVAKTAEGITEATPKVAGTILEKGAQAGQNKYVQAVGLTATGHPVAGLGVLAERSLENRFGSLGGWLMNTRRKIMDSTLGKVEGLGADLRAIPEGPYRDGLLQDAQSVVDKNNARLNSITAKEEIGPDAYVFQRHDDGSFVHPEEFLPKPEKEIRRIQIENDNQAAKIAQINHVNDFTKVAGYATKLGLATAGNVGVGATIGGLIGGVNAQPGDDESAKRMAVMGAMISAPFAPFQASGALRDIRMEAGREAFKEAGKDSITPDHPNYEAHQEAYGRLDQQGKDAIDVANGMLKSMGGKAVIILPKEEFLKMQGGDASKAPGRGFVKDGNIYLNADKMASGVVHHELTHFLPQALGQSAFDIMPDLRAKMEGKQTSQAYKDMESYYNSISPDASKTNIPEEVLAETGRRIMNDMPPELFYGGESGADVLKRWGGKILEKAAPSWYRENNIDPILKTPISKADEAAVRSKLFEIGQRKGQEPPRNAPDEPPATTIPPDPSKRATGPTVASEPPISAPPGAVEALTGLGEPKKSAQAKVDAATSEIQSEGGTPTLEEVVRRAVKRTVPEPQSPESTLSSVSPPLVSSESLSQAKEPTEGRSGALASSKSPTGSINERPEAMPSEPASLEGGSDRLLLDSKLLSDLLESKAFLDHGLGGLDIPTQRTVMGSVIAGLHNHEIFNSVIKLVPVDVVNMLLTVKEPSQVVLHDPTVLSPAATINSDHSVSIKMDVASELANATALASKKLHDMELTPRSLSRQSGDNNAGKNVESTAPPAPAPIEEIPSQSVPTSPDFPTKNIDTDSSQSDPKVVASSGEVNAKGEGVSRENPMLVGPRTDKYGKKSVSGRIFDPSIAEHADLAAKAGLDEANIAKLKELSDKMGETVGIDYSHAPEEGEGRKEAQKKTLAQARIEGAKREKLSKTFVPSWIEFTNGTGKAVVRGFSPDKFFENAKTVFDKYPEVMEGKYRDVNDPQLISDFQKYAQNHANGYTGMGKPIEGTDLTPVKPNPNFEPNILPEDRASVINALMGDTSAAEGVRKASPVKLEKRALAKANAPFFDSGTGETNKIRAKEGDMGLEPVSETLRPELIDKIREPNVADEHTIRPSGAAPESRATLAKAGAPNSTYVASGFMPDGRPDAIAAAAIKTRDGDIWTGYNHANARDKADMDFNTPGIVHGFVDGNGKFYTQIEAARHAQEIGQLTKKEMLDAQRGLSISQQNQYMDSETFGAARRFMPDSDFKGKTIEAGEEPWSVRLKELETREWNGGKLTDPEQKELLSLHKQAREEYGSYANWFEKMGAEKDYVSGVFGDEKQKPIQFMPDVQKRTEDLSEASRLVSASVNLTSHDKRFRPLEVALDYEKATGNKWKEGNFKYEYWSEARPPEDVSGYSGNLTPVPSRADNGAKGWIVAKEPLSLADVSSKGLIPVGSASIEALLNDHAFDGANLQFKNHSLLISRNTRSPDSPIRLTKFDLHDKPIDHWEGKRAFEKFYYNHQNNFSDFIGVKAETDNPKFMPAPHIEREAERLGLQYTGDMGEGERAIHIFNDPITKSTISIKADAEKGALQEKLKASRDRFGARDATNNMPDSLAKVPAPKEPQNIKSLRVAQAPKKDDNPATIDFKIGTKGSGYNTPLTAKEVIEFDKWKAKYAPKDSGKYYDLRGAFKAGLKPANGHWPDTFKKPNHPTFSRESVYADDTAGTWDGDMFIPAKKPARK